MNGYVTLDTLKRQDVLDKRSGNETNDPRLKQLIESVSRAFDMLTQRHFYVLEATRTFDATTAFRLHVPDLIAVTQIAVDKNNDLVYEEVFVAADFLLYPLNADAANRFNSGSRPFRKIQTDISASNKTFPIGRSTIEVQGRWGYWEHLKTAAETESGAINGTVTSVTLNTGEDVEVGHTIIIDSEQMFVTDRSDQVITVERGVNGTTATAHIDAAPISIYEYPNPITEAVIITIARLWRRKESNFANVIGTPDGSMQIFTGLDDDVKMMVRRYRSKTMQIIIPQDRVRGRNQLSDIDVLRLNTHGF